LSAWWRAARALPAALRSGTASALLATAAFGAACSSAAPQPVAADAGWVGVVHSDAPAGLSRGSSALMETQDGITYGLVEMIEESGRMVWLEKGIGHEPDGDARWQVLAVLPLPALEAGDIVLFAGAWCTVDGAYDPEIVAVVNEGSGAAYRVRSAWRARRAEARFEPVGSESVECFDAGHEG
jgi:hypothetical protein